MAERSEPHDVTREVERRAQALDAVQETLESDPTPEELAAAAAELHAAHAAHAEETGDGEHADAAREREQRARERAGEG